MPYQPPFEITPTILSQVAEICEQIGRLEGVDWSTPSPYLRKDNRIRSIHSSPTQKYRLTETGKKIAKSL